MRQEDSRETTSAIDSFRSIDSIISEQCFSADIQSRRPTTSEPRGEEPGTLDLSRPLFLVQADSSGTRGQASGVADTRSTDNWLNTNGRSRSNEQLNDLFNLVDRVGQRPPAPQEVSHTLNHRGQTITLRARGGVGSYYRDESGEWDSRNGETWVRRGSNDRDIWHGQISRDSDGNFVQRGTASGVTLTMRSDGSLTRSIQTESGQAISLTEQANGHRQFVRDRTWTSSDGRNWSSGESTWQGALAINARGEVVRTDQTGQVEINYRSRQNAEVRAEMERIGRQYNVSFGQVGETYSYSYQNSADGQSRQASTVLRLPSRTELQELESSLQRYSHVDFGGMRFNFISGAGEGSRVTEWGWYHSSLNGAPQIYFGPRNSLASNGWEAFQGTALHEIAHHLQARRWTNNSVQTIPNNILSFYGFEMNGTSSNRLRDRDGNLWQSDSVRVRDSSNNWSSELRWQPVVGGTVITEAGRARTNRQMYDSMAPDRRPCTQYFTNAVEAHAEALSMLLQNPRMLWDRNQSLYRAAREWDQSDINARHGFQVDGTGMQIRDGRNRPVPTMIRGLDGRIVTNNQANRNRVQEMENGWRTAPGVNQSSRASIHWDEHLQRGSCPCCA